MNTALMLVPATNNPASGFMATALDPAENVCGNDKAMILKMELAPVPEPALPRCYDPRSGFEIEPAPGSGLHRR